jgi:hypothetical protein
MPKASATVIDFTTYRNAALSADVLTPSGPDSEFIATCEKLIVCANAYDGLFRSDLYGRQFDAAKAKLDPEWLAIERYLCGLPVPRTPEGVRAAARMMVAYRAVSGPDDNAWSVKLWAACSLACAAYLAAAVG